MKMMRIKNIAAAITAFGAAVCCAVPMGAAADDLMMEKF